VAVLFQTPLLILDMFYTLRIFSPQKVDFFSYPPFVWFILSSPSFFSSLPSVLFLPTQSAFYPLFSAFYYVFVILSLLSVEPTSAPGLCISICWTEFCLTWSLFSCFWFFLRSGFFPFALVCGPFIARPH